MTVDTMTADKDPFANVAVDHVRFFVGDLVAARERLAAGYGFEVLSASAKTEARSALLGQGSIRLSLVQPLADDHPGAPTWTSTATGRPTSRCGSPTPRPPTTWPSGAALAPSRPP
ncbi:hypothetical protein [Actinomadura sp. CNU-125]|uniref:hypothetical protein n=1 Tax=Actinomadura sp. CNU-125 TaxID=1904961 RepID=UPI0021CC655B|nr:hypothetical protein [Actinomadura sp. CNU-125]